MALPITLSPKWYSVAPSKSLNSLAPIGAKVGLIDNANIYNPIYGIGQTILYKSSEIKVTKSNKEFFLVHESDILCAENPVPTPP